MKRGMPQIYFRKPTLSLIRRTTYLLQKLAEKVNSSMLQAVTDREIFICCYFL